MDKIKKYIEELNSGTKIMFKEFFNKRTNKKQRANTWTFSRLIISPIILILMIIGLPIAAAITATFGALTDFFDGRSARKHNSISEFGKLLDPISDKFFSLFAGVALSIYNPLFLINLIGEGLIATTNITYQVKYNNISIKSSFIGKIKQWPLFATFALGFLSTSISSISNITNSAIVITSLFQIATLRNYIVENKKIVKII